MEIDAYTDNYSDDVQTAQILLISAAEDGDVDHVKDVLLTYSSIRRDLNMGEALCVSALMGHFEVVQLLIQSYPPADIGYKDETGRRPIHYAAKNGNPDILTSLLRHGSIVNCVDGQGITPLLEACTNNNVEAAEVLLSAGASVNSYRTEDRKETILHIAAGLGYADVIRVLLKYSADPTKATPLGSGGLYPLHEAVIKGHAEATRVLSEHRKSVLLRDKKGRSALHFAADSGNLEILEILVASGANVSSKDYDGWPPLIYAIFAGHLAAVDLLITLGTDINTNIGCDDYTPLHFASMTVHDEIALRLLLAGACVDARTRGRRDTPLLTAMSAKGTKDIIKHLLSYGADPNARDFKGNTSLHKSQAIKISDTCEDRDDVMRLLFKAGADLNSRDDHGYSPLQRCAFQTTNRNFASSTLKLLIETGSTLRWDPNMERGEFQRNSPLSWLTWAGMIQDAEYLVRAGWTIRKEPWITRRGRTQTQSEFHLWMMLMASSVPSLKVVCRNFIREHLITTIEGKEILSAINALPLPIAMKDLLRLRDVNDIM